MFKHVFKTPSVQIFLLLRKFCLVEVGLLETRLCKVPIKVVRSTCVDVVMSRSLGYSRSQSSPMFYHRISEGQRSIYTLLYISTWSWPVPTSANWLHVAFSKGTWSPGPPYQDLPTGHSLRPPTGAFPNPPFRRPVYSVGCWYIWRTRLDRLPKIYYGFSSVDIPVFGGIS